MLAWRLLCGLESQKKTSLGLSFPLLPKEDHLPMVLYHIHLHPSLFLTRVTHPCPFQRPVPSSALNAPRVGYRGFQG